jgi:hypothetical protein
VLKFCDLLLLYNEVRRFLGKTQWRVAGSAAVTVANRWNVAPTDRTR